jgi:hypothetical protein
LHPEATAAATTSAIMMISCNRLRLRTLRDHQQSRSRTGWMTLLFLLLSCIFAVVVDVWQYESAVQFGSVCVRAEDIPSLEDFEAEHDAAQQQSENDVAAEDHENAEEEEEGDIEDPLDAEEEEQEHYESMGEVVLDPMTGESHTIGKLPQHVAFEDATEQDPNLHPMTYDVGDGPQTTLVYVEPTIADMYRHHQKDDDSESTPGVSKQQRVAPQFNGFAGKFINMSNKKCSLYWYDYFIKLFAYVHVLFDVSPTSFYMI